MTTSPPTVVITGAASGIGRAASARIVERGARVIAVDRDGDALTLLGADLGDAIVGSVQADLAAENEIARAAEEILDLAPDTDRLGLVNNLGIGTHAAFLDSDRAGDERVFAINVLAMMSVTRRLLPRLIDQGGGAVVNVASVAGQLGGGLLGDTAYAATKGAVLAFTRAIAREFGPHGVRCNTVVPGLTRTPATEWAFDEHEERLVSMIPLGRPGEAGEVGEVIAYLATEVPTFVSGAFVNVDGGTVRP